MALALAIGAAAGVGAVLFRYLILGFTRGFTGYDDYSMVGPAANPHVPVLGRWFVLVLRRWFVLLPSPTNRCLLLL